MDDKMFELISKMYSEMQEGFKAVNERLGKLEAGQIRLEDKSENNSKALFDGYKQSYEKLTDIEKKLEDVSAKVEKQDVEIRVIKNVANQ